MIGTELVYQDGHEIKLLTDQCETVFVPGYGGCAADNKTGKLSRWVDKYMEDNKSRKAE